VKTLVPSALETKEEVEVFMIQSCHGAGLASSGEDGRVSDSDRSQDRARHHALVGSAASASFPMAKAQANAKQAWSLIGYMPHCVLGRTARGLACPGGPEPATRVRRQPVRRCRALDGADAPPETSATGLAATLLRRPNGWSGTSDRFEAVSLTL
jgi:hypothetical protein